MRERQLAHCWQRAERRRVACAAELVDALVGVIDRKAAAARALDDVDLRGRAVVRLVEHDDVIRAERILL